MGNVDGSFRCTAKRKLLENLNLQPTTDKPEVYYILTDMSMLFCLATPTTEDREKKKRDGSAYKWIDYIRKIGSMVHTRHPFAVQYYAINDDYEKQYIINDDERDRRAGDYPDARNKFPKHSDKFPGPKEFNSFMSDCGNKARLQALVCQFIENREDSHKIIYVNNGEASIFRTGEIDQNLRFNHPEADTTIFGIHAKLRDGYEGPIIIDSEDTDIYVQAAYVARNVPGKLYIKRRKYLVDCDTLVDDEVADSIISAHVISGSDHTSGFYHRRKSSIMKSIKQDAEARELLFSVGENPELSEHVEASMEEFVLSKLYNSEESSCDKARAAKWHSQKNKTLCIVNGYKAGHPVFVDIKR